MKHKLLDLFCGAGGCSVGYHRAGFEVVGVDINPQPRYPYAFIKSDALEYCAAHGHEFNVIHASPPCQAYSVTRSIHGNDYPELIEPTRAALVATGKPYIIENVPGAPLINPFVMCGTMFNLRVYRHRLFELNFPIELPEHKPHTGTTNSNSGYSSFGNGASFITMAGNNFSRADAIAAMNGDCTWMNKREMAQAIPPAYTEWIGKHLLEYLGVADD